jgi:hypothetical protein
VFGGILVAPSYSGMVDKDKARMTEMVKCSFNQTSRSLDEDHQYFETEGD